MPFRDDLLSPIPGDNPSGVSLHYDPVTDKLKEARREDIDAPQGAWKSALKVADNGQVIKLASEAIAAKGKDLQVAVWLVDAHIRHEGFAAVPHGFRFLEGLLGQFWDTLHPEIEDGDLEVRAAPLEWLGSKLPEPLRALPITSNRLSWNTYKDSRTVGYETEATTEEKRRVRQQLLDDGKLSAEEFDQALEESPKVFYESLQAIVEDSLAALASLIELCDSKFGDFSPSFVKTRGALDDLGHFVKAAIDKKGGPTMVAEEPVEEVAEAPVESSASVAPVSAAAAPAARGAARSTGNYEPSSPEDAALRLAAIARYLRGQDVYHIGPYLMLRGFRFGEIRYNGPQIDAAMLEPPPPELRKRLKQYAADGDWDKVLESTEAAMEQSCARGWLDVQRYAVKALENKGEYFRFVADAVRTELRGLLSDLPALADMSLLDDTPAANPETRAWIRQEVLTPLSDTAGSSVAPPPEPSPAPSAPSEPDVPVVLEDTPPSMEAEPGGANGDNDVFDSALEAVGAGRFSEAVQMLSAQLDQERSGRARFKRRMQLAHIFLAGGRSQIAYPILEGLAEEIDRRGLEDWESGEVLAYPLALFLKCLRSSDDAEKRKAVYARLCRLHPADAMNYSE